MPRHATPAKTIDQIARERHQHSIVECNRVSFLITMVDIKSSPHFEIWVQGASTGQHHLELSAHHPTDTGSVLSVQTAITTEDETLTCVRQPVRISADIPPRPFRMTVFAQSTTENGGKRIREQTGRKFRNVDVAPRTSPLAYGGTWIDMIAQSIWMPWNALTRRFDDGKHALDAGFSAEVNPPSWTT